MKTPPPWLALLADIREGRGLDALAAAWGKGDAGAGRWYAESLRTYLGGTSSQASAQTFRSVLAFFFAWVSEHRAKQESVPARLLSPDEILESDVKAWGTWLTEGGSWVVPAFAGTPTEQALVQLVEDRGVGAGLSFADLATLAQQRGIPLPSKPGELSALLGQLVRRRFIARHPRLADVMVEGEGGVMRKLRPGEAAPHGLFRYLAVRARGEVAPATVAARLSVLAGFFRAMMRPKNLRGVPCPLSVNPAAFAAEKATRAKVSEERSRSEARKTTRADLHLLTSLIDHAPGRTEVVRARDHLLVALLSSMGLRIGEALAARRGDVGEAPAEGGMRPTLRVQRKGGKAQVLALSERAAEALAAYDTALRESKTEPAIVEVALSPGAPLVHAARRWGHAAEAVDARVRRARAGQARTPRTAREIHPALVPWSRVGAEQMFGRYVGEALKQVAPGQAREAAGRTLRARLHPHGLRHLFAQMAIEGGMPLRVVAHQLGHQGQGTLERTYAPRVDDMLFDYGQLLEDALGGGVPLVPPSLPAPHPAREGGAKAEEPARPRPQESQAAYVEVAPAAAKGEALAAEDLGPATIVAVGEAGRGATFPPSPRWAYQEAPLLLDAGQIAALNAAGRPVPRAALSAAGLPPLLIDRAKLLSGLRSLLPYRLIEARSGGLKPNRAAAEGRLFVPIPCLDRDAGAVGDLVRLGEAVVDPARGERRTALVRWWVYLLASGRAIEASRDLGGQRVLWLPFDGPEPAWNGPTEGEAAWRARVHGRFLRAHEVQAGLGAFLGQHGASWPTGFVPSVLRPFLPQGEMRANAPQALEALDLSAAKAAEVAALVARPEGEVARDILRRFVG